MPLPDGIYHIYNQSSNKVMTLKEWGGFPPEIGIMHFAAAEVEDPEPKANAYQQWHVKYWAESNSYSLLNVATGLYFWVLTWTNGASYIVGKTKPYLIHFEPEAASENIFSIRVKPSVYTLRPYSYWLRITHNDPGPECNWEFKKVSGPFPLHPVLPVATVATLLPGTYRLINSRSKTYLSQKREIEGKYFKVVGQGNISNDPYQEWVVALHEASQTYFIKNHGSGRWLSTEDYSRTDSSPNDFATVADGPIHFEIRMAETESSFSISVYGFGSSSVMKLTDSSENSRVFLGAKNDKLESYDHVWRFEPIRPRSSAVTSSPLPFSGGLKTGTFFIRNASSRTLLTQSESVEATPQILDPLVLGRKDVSGSAFQKWIVSYEKNSQQYFIQNVGSGRYAAPLYGLSGTSLIATEQAKAWNIRQAEEDEEFVIHTPGSALCLDLIGASTADNSAVNLLAHGLRNSNMQQRWVFEPVDPNGKDLQHPNGSLSDDPDAEKALKYLRSLGPAVITDGSDAIFIYNRLSGKAIALRNIGTLPIQGTPITSEDIIWNDTRETWRFVLFAEGSGLFNLSNTATASTMSYPPNARDGSSIVASEQSVTPWDIRSDGTSSLIFVVPHTTLALYSESTESGQGIYLKRLADNDGFKWQPSMSI